MYTWIVEGNGFTIVDDCGEYICDTDTEDKAELLLNVLNESVGAFESRGYDINDVIGGIQ